VVVPAPLPAASGAQLIPGAGSTGAAPASQPVTASSKVDTPAPAIGASGAGQIPTR